MGSTKINFFIIRTFDDLDFTRDDFSKLHTDPVMLETLERITPYRSRMKFEREFGGDGTEASVVFGKSTYSTWDSEGIHSFEVLYSDEDKPRGWQTRDEINDEFLRRSFNKNRI